MNPEGELIETGRNYLIKKDYKLAEDAFNKIIEINPGSEQAYFELGKTYYIQGAYPEAIGRFKKALALNQNNIYARLLLAKSYKASCNYHESIEEFKKVLELGYQEENIHKELYDLYKIINKLDLATEELKKALDAGYDRRLYIADLNSICNLQIKLIQNYNFEGRYSQALREIENSFKLVPEDNLRYQNILLNEMEIAQKKTILSSKIRSLTVSLTNKCNLNCLMCQSKDIPWDLPPKAIQEITTLFPYLERLMWQGGEVFLYQGFKDILIEVSKFPIRQIISTNGLLIDREIAQIMVKSNVELTFSIDGATKEVYEHIRRGANFDRVIEKINLINELRQSLNPRMETRLNVLIMRANYHQLEQFLDFAKEYKFNTVFFNSTGCDFRNIRENVFYYNQDKNVIEHINKIRRGIEEKASEYGIRLENWLPSLDFFNKSQPMDKQEINETEVKDKEKDGLQEDKLFCHAPWQKLYIDCGGTVRPDCLCYVDNYVGNILESSLEDLWNSKGMQDYRSRIINHTYQCLCHSPCVYGRIPEKNLKFI